MVPHDRRALSPATPVNEKIGRQRREPRSRLSTRTGIVGVGPDRVQARSTLTSLLLVVTPIRFTREASDLWCPADACFRGRIPTHTITFPAPHPNTGEGAEDGEGTLIRTVKAFLTLFQIFFIRPLNQSSSSL